MRIYASKGHSLTETDRLELGRLLLKAGYTVLMGKEKIGNMSRQYIEFYERMDIKRTAPGGNDTESGSKEINSTAKIAQEGGDVNA